MTKMLSLSFRFLYLGCLVFHLFSLISSRFFHFDHFQFVNNGDVSHTFHPFISSLHHLPFLLFCSVLSSSLLFSSLLFSPLPSLISIPLLPFLSLFFLLSSFLSFSPSSLALYITYQRVNIRNVEDKSFVG